MPATPRVRGRLGRWALALAAALPMLAAQPADAQGLTGSGGRGAPLEIAADQGIEWRRDDQVYIARGNATASRGGVTVRADRLVAHYRDTGGGRGDDAERTLSAGGDTEIYRIEALGGVRISDPRARAEGDKAVYDLDQQVVVLTGRDLRFATDRETITAQDSLEYWQDRDLAVARGNAVAQRGDRRITADVLAARFTRDDRADGDEGGDGDGAALPDGDGARRIDRIEAFGGVEIATPQEYARGDRGIYNAESEVATLIGNVRLTRGDNQLNGGWGQVNLRTGVSRLLGAPPDSGAGQRVRALLQPENADDLEISETGQAEAEGNAADADTDTDADADADAGAEAGGTDQEQP